VKLANADDCRCGKPARNWVTSIRIGEFVHSDGDMQTFEGFLEVAC
jgi:hypothetical protein